MVNMVTHEVDVRISGTVRWLAAIDTSSDRAGVALFDGTAASVVAWNAHRNHTVDTLAQLDHLLRLGGLGMGDLGAVAVATGPGSFSALRVGLSIGKGLAFSFGIPLLGVLTTDAIAGSFAWSGRQVAAVMTAGRGRVVWSRYANGARMDGPRNTTVAELREALPAEALLVGETELLRGLAAVALPAGARVEQIARIGWNRFMAGERDDAAALEPIYAHGRRTQETIPA